MNTIEQNNDHNPESQPQQKQEKLKRQHTKYTPSNVPFRVGYQCYFLLLGLTLFSLSLSSYLLFESAMDYYELIIADWHQQPINSIRMTTGTCNSNEEALINYNWPGTVDGCDCRYRRRMLYERRQLFIRRDKIYNNHACNITQLAYGCTSVYAMDPITFDKFPDITGKNGFQICAIRETENDFYSHAPQSNQCPTGQLKCGSQDDYFYCTKEKQCPIRKLGIKGLILMQNLEEGNSISTQTLVYTRSMTDQLPIAEFKVSEAGVCFKNDERGMTSGRIDYSLMRKNKTECSVDPRFEPIRIDNEYNYYLANGQTKLSTELRGYSISSDYYWGIFIQYLGLYQRPFILWKMSCRGTTMEDFLKQEAYLNDILDSQTSLLIISIIFMVVISFVLTYVSCANITGYDWPCISGKGTEESNYIFYLEIFLKTVIQLPHAVIIILSFARVNTEVKYLEDIIQKNCSDEHVANQLGILKDTLVDNVYGFNLGQLILFIITTTGDFCIAFYLCQSYYREKRKKFSQSIQGNTIEMPQNYNPVLQQQNHDYQDYPQQIPANPYQYNQQQNPYYAQQQPNNQNPYYAQQQPNNQNPYYAQQQPSNQNPFSA